MKFAWSSSALFIVLVLITACLGQTKTTKPSQPPITGTREESKTPENKTTPTDQPSTDYQRGTDQFPVIVKIKQTPKTQEETARDQADREERAAIEILTKRAGIATIIVGFLQVILIGFQVCIARRQNQITEKQNLLSINTERAWIGVKTPRNQPRLDIRMVEEGIEWKTFRFYAKNCGKTVARIVEVRARYHMVPCPNGTPQIAPKPEYVASSMIASPMLIVPNSGFEFAAFFENETIENPFINLIAPMYEGKFACFVYTLIKYIDPVSSEERLTQVCYRWQSVGGFRIGGPPEYNKAT